MAPRARKRSVAAPAPRRTEVVVSKTAFDDADAYTIVRSNATFVRLLRQEGLDGATIAAEAVEASDIAFYDAQVRNGGMPQFVYNSKCDPDRLASIAAGLERMGSDPAARGHLTVFRRLLASIEAQRPAAMTAFLRADTDTYGEQPVLRALRATDLDKRFRALEPLWQRLSRHLRESPNLVVLSIDEMFALAERWVGHAVAR